MKWCIAQGFREDNPADGRITAALGSNTQRPHHMKALHYNLVGAAVRAVEATDAHWATNRSVAPRSPGSKPISREQIGEPAARSGPPPCPKRNIGTPWTKNDPLYRNPRLLIIRHRGSVMRSGFVRGPVSVGTAVPRVSFCVSPENRGGDPGSPGSVSDNTEDS